MEQKKEKLDLKSRYCSVFNPLRTIALTIRSLDPLSGGFELIANVLKAMNPVLVGWVERVCYTDAVNCRRFVC